MRAQKLKAIVAISIYVLIRIILDDLWRKVSAWYSYGFEAVFVCTIYFVFKPNLIQKIRSHASMALGFLCSCGGGFAIYRAAHFAGIVVPFDLTQKETIFLLLILAPILEEFIFRMALWESFKKLLSHDRYVLIVSTAFFSIGHLMAFWTVPFQYRIFVLFQVLYVILLGLAAGWARITHSVLYSVSIHFAFNLGFYLASFV